MMNTFKKIKKIINNNKMEITSKNMKERVKVKERNSKVKLKMMMNYKDREKNILIIKSKMKMKDSLMKISTRITRKILRMKEK
jgi:hypothetical protein